MTGKEEQEIWIAGENIRLDRFLKWSAAAATGGEAKRWIQEGKIRVNGEEERRRSRILKEGDRVYPPGDRVLLVKTGGEKSAPGKHKDEKFPQL